MAAALEEEEEEEAREAVFSEWIHVGGMRELGGIVGGGVPLGFLQHLHVSAVEDAEAPGSRWRRNKREENQTGAERGR